MEKLLLFFAAASIGIALRFFVLGEWEWKQLLIASCFLGGALLIWGIERWLNRLDARYEEAEDEDAWHTHNECSLQRMCYLITHITNKSSASCLFAGGGSVNERIFRNPARRCGQNRALALPTPFRSFSLILALHVL